MPVNSTDPLVWARDDCGDLIIPLRRAVGLEAVAILIRAAVGLFRDEWFLNRDAGVEWLPTEDGVVPERDAVLGQPYNPAKEQLALRKIILKVTAVRSVSEIKSSFDGGERALAMSCVARTDFGDVPVSTTIALP
jgi:hypothetical protein